MPKAKSAARKTVVAVPADLDGWLEFSGRGFGGGASAYLMDLARRDRDRFMSATDTDGAAERYRAFLFATGRDAELEAIEGGAGHGED